MTEKSANGFAGLLVILMLTAILAGVFYMRNKDSISVAPAQIISAEAAQPEGTIHFWQMDPAWKDMPMNGTPYNLGDSGCLVCCIGAVIALQDIPVEVRTDPASLNVFLGAHGVYDPEANILWEPLERALSVTAVRKDADELADGELDAILAQGYYPIVRVRMNGIGSFHFVLITGIRDGEYYCMDPALQDGEEIPLSRYGDRIYAVRYLIPQAS